MRRECRDRFPRPRYERKLFVSDPRMHHGTYVMQFDKLRKKEANYQFFGRHSVYDPSVTSIDWIQHAGHDDIEDVAADDDDDYDSYHHHYN